MVAFIVINAIAFVVLDIHDSNFWCGYAFVTLSWIELVSVGCIASNEEEGYYLNAPGMVVSLIHLFLQLCLAIIVISVKAIKTKYAFCIALIIMGVYISILIALNYYKSLIRK